VAMGACSLYLAAARPIRPDAISFTPAWYAGSPVSVGGPLAISSVARSGTRAADRQPPPQSAPAGRPRRTRTTRELGLLPRPRRAARTTSRASTRAPLSHCETDNERSSPVPWSTASSRSALFSVAGEEVLGVWRVGEPFAQQAGEEHQRTQR